MAHQPQPLPTSLGNGPFAVSAARAAGVGKKRLRGRDLDAPFRGVRTPAGSVETIWDRCRAASLRLTRDQFFSHSTALELFDLPVPSRLRAAALHVSSPLPMRAPRAAGITGHSVKVATLTVMKTGRIRVVHPVHAWCQLADQLSLRELVVIGDALVRRQEPWATMDELHQAVVKFRGRRGSRRLTEALSLVRPRTDSPPETELRLDIVAAGLPEPGVNVPIDDATGQFVALGDLVFEEYGVVVEYDGEHHRTSDQQYARDVERLDDLARLGRRVIRVNKHHRGIKRRVVLQKIRTALIERGWTPDA